MKAGPGPCQEVRSGVHVAERRNQPWSRERQHQHLDCTISDSSLLFTRHFLVICATGFPGGMGGMPGGVRFTTAGGMPGGMGGGRDPFEFFNMFFGSSNPFASFGGAGGPGGAGGGDDDEDGGGGFGGGGMPGMRMGGMPGGFGGMGGMPGMGGPRTTQRRGPQKPEPIKRQLLCTLEDLYSGTTKKLKITRWRVDPSSGTRRQEERILEIPIRPGFKVGSTHMRRGHVGGRRRGVKLEVVASVLSSLGNCRACLSVISRFA